MRSSGIAEELTAAPDDGGGDLGDRMVCRSQGSRIQALHPERDSSGVVWID